MLHGVRTNNNLLANAPSGATVTVLPNSGGSSSNFPKPKVRPPKRKVPASRTNKVRVQREKPWVAPAPAVAPAPQDSAIRSDKEATGKIGKGILLALGAAGLAYGYKKLKSKKKGADKSLSGTGETKIKKTTKRVQKMTV